MKLLEKTDDYLHFFRSEVMNACIFYKKIFECALKNDSFERVFQNLHECDECFFKRMNVMIDPLKKFYTRFFKFFHFKKMTKKQKKHK